VSVNEDSQLLNRFMGLIRNNKQLYANIVCDQQLAQIILVGEVVGSKVIYWHGINSTVI
jgi:hypothetical protein